MQCALGCRLVDLHHHLGECFLLVFCHILWNSTDVHIDCCGGFKHLQHLAVVLHAGLQWRTTELEDYLTQNLVVAVINVATENGNDSRGILGSLDLIFTFSKEFYVSNFFGDRKRQDTSAKFFQEPRIVAFFFSYFIFRINYEVGKLIFQLKNGGRDLFQTPKG